MIGENIINLVIAAPKAVEDRVTIDVLQSIQVI